MTPQEIACMVKGLYGIGMSREFVLAFVAMAHFENQKWALLESR